MAGPVNFDPELISRRIGYRFRDTDLIKRALSHKSIINDDALAKSNERLEFVGDRVLGLVTATMLQRAFPDADEGELHRRHRTLVRKDTCADVARELELGGFLLLGNSEVRSGGRSKQAILGDACEALIAAIYLDGGFDEAFKFVERHWRRRMEAADKPRRDAKSALQEWAQGEGMPPPIYDEAARSGPDHEPVFTVRVVISGLEPIEAAGRSKREAEQNSAALLLVKLGLWKDATGDV